MPKSQHLAYITSIISEITDKVLGPDEQPKSAMPKLSGNFLHNKSSKASSVTGFVIDIILLYTNDQKKKKNSTLDDEIDLTIKDDHDISSMHARFLI
jgi:hypothetical protein